ncbi:MULTISPECIES: hypothetical protein [Pseudomonas]|uniref:hypothetical protein n=1 Tax=Pseudomonas TaxID=286 RepID=UPI00117A7DC6|nr:MULTISPECIES: hypothetical protein [Pseudomonas]MBH8320896.1 hypothetical protein [Pseudomonas aeruginosa]MBV5848419.1 hypothetical protein [Pseudomonas aeruginosa]TRO97475.1 hypothetical protein FNL66_33350 [Pseudomonas aeruginosa]WGT17376.1 hypothetical protein P4N66_gene3466 [Pseudomonas aeruginosa]HBN9474529.1 hypothetical protein [Pseudomonas aeruginosa]
MRTHAPENSELIQFLPPFLKDMADRIGPEKTLSFVKGFEGKSLRIPLYGLNKSGKMQEAIKSVVGESTAKEIMRHYGGECIYIGSIRVALAKREVLKRNIEINNRADALIRQGVPIREIVKEFSAEYDLCDRQICKILGYM